MVNRKVDLLNWGNVLTYVLVVIVNALAGSTTLIGGKVTADISDANFTLVTPAGYVFSIWGVIYVLLGAFVIYQLLPANRTKYFQKQVSWLFIASNLLNVLWLFAWQYEQLVLSVLIMLLLLVSLIMIYLRINDGREKGSLGEKLAVRLPFSVYLGWITIATIANISAMLVSINWDGFGIGPEIWAAVVILVALLIAVLMAMTRRDIAYELVIIWAFIGIAMNQISQIVIALSLLTVAVSAVVLIAAIYYHQRHPFGRYSK